VADLFAAFDAIDHDIIIIIAEKDTKTALYFLCSTFFQRSHEAVIAGACRRYFTNVCLHFNLKFLKQNKRVHSFHIPREIVLYVLFLSPSAPKIRNATSCNGRPVFLAHSV